MTYNVFGGTLNLAVSIYLNLCKEYSNLARFKMLVLFHIEI